MKMNRLIILISSAILFPINAMSEQLILFCEPIESSALVPRTSTFVLDTVARTVKEVGSEGRREVKRWDEEFILFEKSYFSFNTNPRLISVTGTSINRYTGKYTSILMYKKDDGQYVIGEELRKIAGSLWMSGPLGIFEFYEEGKCRKDVKQF